MNERKDRRGMSLDALRAEARALKLGPDGIAGGRTSWIVNADSATLHRVLDAFDQGGGIPGVPFTPAASAQSGDVAAAAAMLAEALANRPGTLDETRVAEMIAEAVKANASGAVHVTVTSPLAANVPVGVQHAGFPTLVKLVGMGIPVLLVGPKGSGKSEAARACAKALALDFKADSFSQDSGRHDVFGFVDASSRYVPTSFRAAFADGGLYCGDELDNGTANLGAAFNLALSNGHASFPDCIVPRHDSFRMVATANTIHGATLSYNGREAVDGALLDRFAVLAWPIDTAFERALARAHNPNADAWVDTVQRVRTAADAAGLDRLSPSPRASLYGARALAEGMSREACLEAFVYKACDADSRERLAVAAGRK